LSGRKTKLRNSERELHLSRSLLLPHESAFVKAIEETTSINSHGYLGISYAYKSVVFALLQQLLWLKKMIQRLQVSIT